MTLIPFDNIENSINKLENVEKYLTKNQQFKEPNELWYYNILIDVMLNLSVLKWHYGDNKVAALKANKAINLCQKYGDEACLVRLYVYKGLFQKRYKRSILLLDDVLKNMSDRKKNGPYVKFVIGETSQNEISIGSSKYAEDIKALFKSYNIYPIEQLNQSTILSSTNKTKRFIN